MTIEKLNVFKLLNKKSFFLRKKTTYTFLNVKLKKSSVTITSLINVLKKRIEKRIAKFLSTFDLISQKSHQSDSEFKS
jgi:hypothetical protein